MPLSTRGFCFRLWVVIALVWWVGSFFIIAEIPVPRTHPHPHALHPITRGVYWIIFPPIVLYIIGRVVYWFYKGFKGDEKGK